MKNPIRVAAALAALGLAAPALPCGLMQHEAEAVTPAPVVSQSPSTQEKAQPQKVVKKKAAAQKKTTVAKG